MVLIGDVGGEVFHVGDEAMMDANLALLRRAQPAPAVKVIGGGAGRMAIAEAMADVDAAFISGGGNLSDTWPQLLDQRLAVIEEAARRSIPVVVGGQTVGPSLTGGRRERLAERLADVALFGTRDSWSRELVRELGAAPERVVYQADDAFGLTGTPPDGDELLAAAEAPYIAVSLDGSYAPQEAQAGLRRLAMQLATLCGELGLAVVFVPHCGRLGEHEGDDPSVGRKLASLLRLAGVRCHTAPVLPVDQTAWLAHRSALTISSRYHALVFASAAARPGVGLFRDPYGEVKLRGALEHVGAERWCLPTAAAEAGGLVAMVRELWAEREQVVERMASERVDINAREAARRSVLLRELGLVDGGEPAAADELPAPPVQVTSNGDGAHRRAPARPSGPAISDDEWDGFTRDGFLHLGQVLDPGEVERLTARADDLAMGRVHNEHVQMQLDTGGAYEDLPEAVESFDQGTRFYRKIQGLELDDAFIPLVRDPRFLEVCARIYGRHVPLSIFRAMVMNKPAGQGTTLPWHQDGGDVWALDREPLVTIWVALDPATPANGCMEAVRGSHRLGLLTQFGSTLSDEHAAQHCPPGRIVPLEVPTGHAVLMHNWLIHRSGVNPSPIPRRAVTICYLDGRTRSVLTGDHWPLVSGDVDTAPIHYVNELDAHAGRLQASFTEAEAYAHSLEAEVARLRTECTRLQGEPPSS